MPELAEVEHFRRRWLAGLRQPIVRVHVHCSKRVFRGIPANQLQRELTGTRLLGSQRHGKQILFRFSKQLWLGVHLGMTGELRVEPPDYVPTKHDHFALLQKRQTLVFRDPRLFGRIRVHHGKSAPDWWSSLPIPVGSAHFTAQHVQQFLQKHRRLAIKPALLLQSGFPGIGNWMADEILWCARIHPQTACDKISGKRLRALWIATRWVAETALETITPNFDDPPPGWLFHQRWKPHGQCPTHRVPLRRESIGGRTTAWCPLCQPES